MAIRPPAVQVQRVVSALVVIKESGWKPVVNLRTDNCSQFIGFAPEQGRFEAMITDRRQGRRDRTSPAQERELEGLGWNPPESEMVRAFERTWPLDDDERVAREAIQALGAYGWGEREPVWIQLTFNRLPRRPLDLERALAVLTPFTLIVIHPHIAPHHSAARARCAEAVGAKQCHFVLQAARGRALERITKADELAGAATRRPITHLLHPDSPAPDWLDAWGQPR